MYQHMDNERFVTVPALLVALVSFQDNVTLEDV
jgi:hypothetical protein